jgi:hypothetical protein
MPGNAPWSMNIRSCTTTWITLYRLKQIRKTFSEAGDILMKDLKFFNPTLSNDALKQEAAMLADMIDVVFIVGRGAKYEAGATRTKAVSDMIEILTGAENSVAEFAQANDLNYIFWNEKQ